MWKSEERVGSFHHVGPRDGTQVVRIDANHLSFLIGLVYSFLFVLF